jgi:hypothetical protein
MYTLTVTKWEPLTTEEKEEMSRRRGFNDNMPYGNPDMPYGMREARMLQVQLTPEEWKAVKAAAVEAIML